MSPGLLLLLFLVQSVPAFRSDPPIACPACDGWNEKQEPFRVFGNTYYVGVKGLSALLVTSDNGLILMDGGLPQSAPIIDANIRQLGFRTADIKLIVTSHTHYDHIGGVAALQRASGAVVAASPSSARALERGLPDPDDPQASAGVKSPPVPSVRVVSDGEVLRVGTLAIAARFTPGHTPGSTTWTWRSCEGARCLDVVYADSLNAVSMPGFQFTRQSGLVESFRRSIDTVAARKCDVLISVHPEFVDMDRKLAERTKGVRENPFIDARACTAYAARATRTLDARIAEERSSASK